MSNMKGTALATLIDETEATNKWTDVDVVRQSRGAATRLTTQDISNYRVIGMKQIVPGKLIALSRGLDLPAYRVALAVLADYGIEVPADVRSPEAAIHHDHTLPARTRETLLLLIDRERSGS